jgi:dolichyl-phosphate beta-glucosyltransferase
VKTPDPNRDPVLPSSGTHEVDPAAISLSIVIPAYNESGRLGRTLESIRRYAGRIGATWEVIVVDDGSTDGTGALARRFEPGPQRLTVLVNPRNSGKGFSVREGVMAAGGSVILMCDADLSTPIEEVEKLLPWIERGYDVAIGSRHLPESVIDPPQPFQRRLMDAVFRRLRRLMMLRDLCDTQCGFKCFTRTAGRRVFSLLTEHGFGFDCEVLWHARRLGYGIKEVAVRWGDDRGSHVRPVRDAYEMLRSLFVIRRARSDPDHVRAHSHSSHNAD